MKKEKERRKSTIDKREYMYHTNEQTNKRMEKKYSVFCIKCLRNQSNIIIRIQMALEVNVTDFYFLYLILLK
jgi:hypothetical protein